MSLPLTEVALETLSPIQPYVHARRLAAISCLEVLPPIEVVAFDGINLIVDGHHRAYSSYVAGINTLPIRIARKNADIAGISAVAIAGCLTMEQIRDRYEKLWLPNLVENGVTSVVTMKVKDPLQFATSSPFEKVNSDKNSPLRRVLKNFRLP